jgi:putative ABC transport system ATP-binding protein
MSFAVRAIQIIKEFPSADNVNRVLNGIDMQIKYGELTMLVGPSGCGKTTLLSILSGIMKPSQGKVVIGDTALSELKDKEKVLFRRSYLGFVFQQFNLLPHLTAAENAAIPLIAAGMIFKEAIKASKKMLAQVGLQQHADKKPNQLSGGQQQRVAFARALVHQPKVIICDEPTSALDAHTGHQIMETLQSIAVQPNSAVVVVTHDNRIYPFADRIIHMNDGNIVKDEAMVKNT